MPKKKDQPQIVLKHLSRDYDVDPYQLRQMLRKKFGKHPRWKWDSEKDPELKRIRRFLSEATGKSPAGSSGK